MENNFNFPLSPVEYLRLGNFLLRVAKRSKDAIEGKYASKHHEYLYKNAVLFLDKLGISEAEIEEANYED